MEDSQKTQLLRYVSVSLSMIFLLFGEISAQEVIATSGESLQSSNVTVDFTLGEIVVHTVSNSNVIVTQGFHQSFEEVVAALGIASDLVNISVFPNPASTFLKIETEDTGDFTYKLYNLSGIEILEGDFNRKTEIDIKKYAKGLYQLLFTNSDNQLVQTLKIQLK